MLLFAAIFAAVLFVGLPGNNKRNQQDTFFVDELIDNAVEGPNSIEGPSEELAKQPSSYFFDQRAYPKGRIDIRAVNRARAGTAVGVAFANATSSPSWIQRGPNNVQGRVTDIAVDPLDNSIAYVAAAEGGVFRTMDSGQSWDALFDFESSLSMGAVAIDPINRNVIYAGTGEVNPGGGSLAYGGAGLYRSTDQGNTWTNIGLQNSGAIGRIIIHPTNPDIMHVAVMGHLWTAGPDRGIYRTTDGGATWTNVLFVNSTTGCVDLIQRDDNPDVLYAAMWQRIRQPEFYDYGGIGCGVYRSDDGGVTWSLVGNGLPAPSADTGRIGLAIGRSDPDVMCAVYADRTGFFDGLYRTEDGGASWFRTNDSSLSNVFSSFGWWFGNVRIDAFDADVIYVLGLRMYRSGDAGLSYSQIGNNMHVDHHAMDFGSNIGDNLYAGNDGGVYLSSDGINYVKTTGDLPITQAYRIATRSWNTSALWIGTQDNGTSQDLDGDGDFDFIYGGDGFEPLPHPTDPNRIWAQYQYGNVAYSDNQGASFSSATGGLSGRFNWNAPHTVDPSDPETRYFGSNMVFRNVGNLNWVSISGDLTGGPHLGNNGQVNGTLTAISVSPVDSDVIWTGSDDGYVHVTADGGNTWTDVSSGLPLRWVTSIRPDQNSSGKAFITLSGFRWGESSSQVFRTEDFGQTWTSIGDDIPDGPANDILIDPADDGRYFVATDFGVYQTNDAGTSWARLGTGLPNVVVNDLSFLADTRELFAGTYGRSIFSVTVPAPTEVLPLDFEIVIGQLQSGGVPELTSSDDQYLVSDPQFLNSRYQLLFTVDATSPVATPTALRFTLESKVMNFVGTVDQRIELFNYNTGFFEQVDSRQATAADSVVTVTPGGDPTRFVESVTGAMRAQIRYQNSLPYWVTRTANLYLPFRARVDQTVWTITP